MIWQKTCCIRNVCHALWIVIYRLNCMHVLYVYFTMTLLCSLIPHFAGHVITYPCWYLWNMMRLYGITRRFFLFDETRHAYDVFCKCYETMTFGPGRNISICLDSFLSWPRFTKMSVWLVKKVSPVGISWKTSIATDVTVIHPGPREMTGVPQQMFTNVEKSFASIPHNSKLTWVQLMPWHKRATCHCPNY